MVSQDRVRQERLLSLAGWLHHKHRFQTVPHGQAFTEFRFTRANLDHVPALREYSLQAGEAGERALLRDVSALRSFAIDTQWDPGTQEWVSRASPLSDEECRALAMAALYVLIDDGSAGKNGYHVPGAGLSAEGAEVIVAYAPMTDVLIEAIRTRTPVAIEHRGSKGLIDPWHIYLTDGRWYLIGRDHQTDQARTLTLDSIVSVELSGQPGAYSLLGYQFDAGRRVSRDPHQPTEGDPIEVTLEVHPRLLGRAKSLLDAEESSTQGQSDWIAVTCTIRSFDTFLSRLWGLRARAVVTEPAHVRERVVDALKGMV